MRVLTFDGVNAYYNVLIRFLNSGECNQYYYSDCLGDSVGRECAYFINRTISGEKSYMNTTMKYNPEVTHPENIWALNATSIDGVAEF